MTRAVVKYSRPGCHLCEEARAVLDGLRERVPFVLTDVDIETDPALHARYLERIPVVALDGEELFDYHVDVEELERRLRYSVS